MYCVYLDCACIHAANGHLRMYRCSKRNNVYITASSPVHAQILTCQVNGAMVPCPPVACPGDQVTFIGTTPLVGSNLWVLPNGSCSSSTTPDSIVLTQTPGACRAVTMTCGPYTATNGDPGPSTPCVTSNLTVRVSTGMASSLVQTGTRSLAAQDVIVNTTEIKVIGKCITVCDFLNTNNPTHVYGTFVT